MLKKNKYQVHESSIIDDGVSIGDFTKIWHWTHICSGAKIGKNCSIGQNVFIGNKVIIGDNVKIQNNVSIFDNVIIENDVFCGPSMVFTNVINPRAEISRKDEYQNTLVKRGATLGANCTIICGVEIGEYSFVGAGAVVNSSTKNFALVLGVPAFQKGWMSAFGEKIPLNILGDGKWTCNKTGSEYILMNDYMYKR